MPPQYVMLPQLQSTCHYIVNHYVKILHVHLGVANNMHPLSWGGGTNGKDPTKFVGIRYAFRETLRIRNKHFHVKERSAEKWSEETIYISFDIYSSAFINSGSSICEGFPLQRPKTGLYFGIIADFIEQVGIRVTDVIRDIATFWIMKSMRYIKVFSTCAS